MAKQHISVYLKDTEKELIAKAGEVTGLDFSSFFRFCALEKAREIINKTKGGDSKE